MLPSHCPVCGVANDPEAARLRGQLSSCRCKLNLQEKLLRSQLRQAAAADEALREEFTDDEWVWLFGDKPRE